MIEAVEERRDELERLADREDLRTSKYAQALLEEADSGA
jgi:hypothetical protein